MINVAYHKTELCFPSQPRLTDVLTELVVTKCSFFYRWLLPSGDCYEVISLRTPEDMLLFSVSFTIFYMSSCTSGKDDPFNAVQPYNAILEITTLHKLSVVDKVYQIS